MVKDKLGLLYKEVIDCLDFSNFPIKFNISTDDCKLYVTIEGTVCRETKIPKNMVLSRDLLITNDKLEITKYIYWNIQELLLHEAAECFYVNGRRLYDPHENTDKQGLILGIPDISWDNRTKRVS